MQIINNSFELSNYDAKDCFIHNKATYKIIQKIASNVFIIEDPIDENQKIIKICKVPSRLKRNKMVRRFEREIDALKKVKETQIDRVIEIYFDGSINVTVDKKKNIDDIYRFFVMEKADYTLREYLENNAIDVDERFMLCRDMLDGLKDLHSIDVYHRDIKPENVLFVGNYLKIADLGLIAFRKEDDPIDKRGDRIGPHGWLSPEVMNKVYTENVKNGFEYDCVIDEKSDVFQLGKLFWYIFQGNIPIGQIISSDFKRNLDSIFNVIIKMTQYSKDRRSFLKEVEAMLIPLAPEFNG